MANYNNVVLLSKSKLDELSRIIQEKFSLASPLTIDLMIGYIEQLEPYTGSPSNFPSTTNNEVISYNTTDTMVLVTKSKLDDLANVIQDKFSITSPLSLDLMIWCVTQLNKSVITEGLELTLNDEGTAYTVTGYNGTATDVYISNKYNGLPITSIGNDAFYDCDSLTSVRIGDSVTRIGERAFEGCDGLTSVTIPNSVTRIDTSAFHRCASLTSVTIGNSVTSIGYEAFSFCLSLISVTIGNSVTSIGEWAFHYCESLTSVTIPDSVTSIGKHAFYGCSALRKIFCMFSKGEVADAPWGATDATIYYDVK